MLKPNEIHPMGNKTITTIQGILNYNSSSYSNAKSHKLLFISVGNAYFKSSYMRKKNTVLFHPNILVLIFYVSLRRKGERGLRVVTGLKYKKISTTEQCTKRYP